MGRSRIGWAGSVVAPWCLAAGVLLSITAEAEQEPMQLSGVYDRTRLQDQSDPVRRAIALAINRQAVDADGMPVPLVQAHSFAPDDDSSRDETEPKATMKVPTEPFPDVDRATKGDPFIGRRPGFSARAGAGGVGPDLPGGWPRDSEFDPGHTMSPVHPGDPERAPDFAASTFSDGATPTLPLEFALNSSSPTSSDGVVVAVVADPNARDTTVVATVVARRRQAELCGPD